jgi:hypothetical protein
MPQQEAAALWRDHWQMDITLLDGDGEVTAKARLRDGTAVVTGTGSVHVDQGVDHDGAHDRPTVALAVRRSLEDVAESLGYLIDLDSLAAIEDS